MKTKLNIKQKSHVWQYLLLCPMMLCACSGVADEPQPDGGNIPVSFAALSQWNNNGTRLAEGTDGQASSFETGDAIGVFAYKNGSSTPDFMNNQCVTLDKTGTWTYSPTKYWPTAKDDRLSFYAYYPYSCNDIAFATASAPPSLTYNSGNAAKDVLVATAKDQIHSEQVGNVQLQFRHLLAKVKFTFSTSDNSHPVVHALKYNVPTKGEYKFAMPVEWASVSSDKYELLRITNNSEGVVVGTTKTQIDEFTAYILPCDISKFSVSIDNVFVDYTPSSAVKVKAGYQYTINFVISDGGANVFITSYSLWETDENTHEGQLK